MVTPTPLAPLDARVLVAEDNAVNAEIARTLLEQFGCSVDVVDDGAKAVAATAGGGYDVVLMDCQMPVMDGFAATAAIRARDVGTRVPIIALTADGGDDRARCLAHGMDDHLSKPFDKGQLHGVVARWLAAGAQATSAPDGPAVLDEAVFGQLRNLEGPHTPGIVGRLIETFIEDADEMLPTLMDAGDDEVRRAAHSLKSSAANMGACRLAEALAALEAAPADDRARLVAAATAAFAEVRPLLLAELAPAGQATA